MQSILDSGQRYEFKTGAKRDISINKGRCDLLPLRIVSHLVQSKITSLISDYIEAGESESLYEAIKCFSEDYLHQDIYTTLLDVSIHFEQGAEKYSERNWEKGILLHSYIDSALRHYFKFCRGDCDERHDRAFVWNLLCALWTEERKKDMIDLPFFTEKNKE